MTEQCGNCRFWVSELTRCRRFPPVLIDIDDCVFDWPGVDSEDWCGEWQPVKPEPELTHEGNA